jgi:Protein of unknown function (DUF3168)
MSIETALFEFLAAQTEVQAILGEASRLRFYPLVVPQKALLPGCVYRFDNTNRGRTYCATDKVVQTRVQLDSYSKNYLEAVQLAAVLRLVLVDFRGMMGTVRVKDVAIDPNSDRDLEDPEPGLYRRWQDYTVWHVE